MTLGFLYLCIHTVALPVMELYADIVLPIAREPFTFRVGNDIAEVLTEGMGVAVQLGPRKIYMGIVWRLTQERPPYKNIKSIEKLIRPERMVSVEQMKLWEWLAEYYMCTLGEVMRFALPSALKPSGLSYDEFTRDEFKPATEKFISLHPAIASETDLNAVLDKLKRAKAQYAAVMEFCGKAEESNLYTAEIPQRRLSADTAIIKKLADREIFKVTERETAAVATQHITPALPQLTDIQAAAKLKIDDNFTTHDCVLLHGVTGSGKTEIYAHLIAEQVAAGKSVLYLMPEIAMTSQLVRRIQTIFGERVTVYHSKLSERSRAEAYIKLNSSTGGEIILGVRSSIFLPLPKLGLIIVDEEHDASFKQSDPAPRYNARDCAVVMSRIYGSKCLLGSATPAIESYVNARTGKYGLVTLKERYGNASLPEIIVSDTLRAVKRGERKTHFNKLLLDKISDTLSQGHQAILFQNRRGFSPYVECKNCGWVAHCPNCSVTLTLHKQEGRLKCHYCGHTEPISETCPSCKLTTLTPCGFGTEKVEDELQALFPSARIVRLDRDTASSGKRYKQILNSFEKGAADILVGTQMITKGYDFAGVSLVGILNADNLINYPDFRASERAYQIMTQVAGRAGRADTKGEVVIQTSQPENNIIRQVVENDYEGMVNTQLVERQIFYYPPCGRLIVVSMKDRNKESLVKCARALSDRLRTIFGNRVFGPHAPVVEKIGGENILTILLKIENGRSAAKAKLLLSKAIAETLKDPSLRNVFITINVDPQ